MLKKYYHVGDLSKPFIIFCMCQRMIISIAVKAMLMVFSFQMKNRKISFHCFQKVISGIGCVTHTKIKFYTLYDVQINWKCKYEWINCRQMM